MEIQTIIFISKSGGGKGTQVKKIIDYINDGKDIFHLEAGDKFRDFVSGTTYASKLAKKINDKGALQPAFLSVWAWTDLLISHLDSSKHLFVDGTPRRLSEARVLDEALDFFERKNVSIVYINVSDDWSIMRMKERGRADDREDIDIKNRLEWFKTDVLPVLDFYKTNSKYKFFEINGEQDIDRVHSDIVEKLAL